MKLLVEMRIVFPKLVEQFATKEEIRQYVQESMSLPDADHVYRDAHLVAKKYILLAEKVGVTENGLKITMPSQEDFKEDVGSRPERLNTKK